MALAGALALGVGVSAAGGTAWLGQLLPSAASGDAAPSGGLAGAANRRPSSLALSNRSVLENQPAGTQVGRLSAKDRDRRERFTYALVSGVGSGGNASFVIEGALLKTRAVFDREVQRSYSIRVRVRDRAGASRDRIFLVAVGDANDAPTTIGLDSTRVMEQQDVGAEVGRLAAADEDVRDNFTFTLVPGEGSADNAMFTIQGVWLRTNTVFVYALRQSYSIRVRATDSGTPGLGFERVFTLRVVQQPPPPNAPPTFVRGSDLSVLEDAGAQAVPGWANTISSGAAGESDQQVSFVVTGNSNPALFASGPALASNGTLTYTPADDANGTATITMKAVDDGAPAAESLPQSFTITVASVNDEPSFDLPASANQLVLPGSGAHTVAGFAANISSGPANESTQTVTFYVSNTNAGLFASQPAIAAASGELTYTPAARAHGSAMVSVTLSDNAGTANGGDDTSATKTFTISVDVPALAQARTGGDAVAATEDTAVQITLAATDADGDALTFSIVAANGTVANVGAVACAGTPTSCTQTVDYTPAANANGPQSFTFKVNDGFTDSNVATVELDVLAVNDAPSFAVPAAAPSVLEDAGTQVMAGLASAMSAGAPDESRQTLTFVVVSNSNPGLFVPISGLPLLDATTGNLTFTPVANTSGTATIEVKLIDDGGTADGGVAESATQSFAITVTAVNDAPSFTKGGSQTVLEDAGAQSVTGWATAFSRGPADEAGQTISFEVTDNTNPGLFSAGPAVSSTGTLTFTLAANAFGTATITVRTRDDGGTANGGVDVSPTQSFDVTVTAVNDVPSLTKGADQTVLEDSGARTVSGWATVSAGPNESAQSVTVEITNNTNATLFSAGPALSATGNLTFTPAANANGTATITLRITDDGGTANGGVDTSATQTFQIVVASVNDAPGFTKGGNQTVLEDAAAQSVTGWATAFSRGPADEAGQTISFEVTGNTNAELFSAGPAVGSTGTLTFTPAANAYGTATITLRARDDGGTTNGGVDASPPQSFEVTVTPVNDVPSFTKGADQTVLEDSGARTVSGWATVSAGPNESAQSVTFEITNNTNAALFSVAPAVSPNGTLSYTPAANAFGSATITARAHDDGGTANGGVDTSATQTFQIVVAAVNDAPSFTKGANQTFDEDSGAHTITDWATGISAGPANESGQTLSFAITNNTRPGLFSAGPSVAPNGTLSFTSAANANGSATITLKATDDGGIADGGVNESPTQTFTITINALNDLPTSPGRAYGANSIQANMQRSIDPASGLFAGALDADDVAGNPGYAPTFTVASLNGVAPTGGTITTTIAGVGTVVANAATGAFTIDPAPGVTGNVSFNFTICDNGEGPPASLCTGTLTASFDIAGPVIWFVNSAAATNGSGTLTSPFNVLSAVPPVDAANHGVFLYSSAAGYTGAFSLNSGETLIGQPTTGTTFDALFGISPPAGTAARPTLGGGTATLTGTLTLASGVKLRGLSLATGASDALVGSGGLTSVDVDQTSITTDVGIALSLDNVAGTITLADLDKNGAGTGISLTNVGANVTVASGATIAATTTAAVDIDQGTGSFSYAGTISNSAGRTVEVTDRNTGSPGPVQFTGPVTGSGGTGINLDNNDNGTVTFSGRLVLSTGPSAAYTAVNGGTVNVTGATNTLTTTTGTALNVANTTIGASGLTFKSISAGIEFPSLALNGIVLSNTGSSGGLTVTGDGNMSVGGNGSGGVIQNTFGDGISLTNTLSPSFTNVTIQGSIAGLDLLPRSGIRGTQVTNFTFANGTIKNVGDTTNNPFFPNESNIRLDDHDSGTERNVSGTVTITNNVLNNAAWNGINILNFSGTISDLTISGNALTSGTTRFGSGSSKGDAISIEAAGTATTVANITKATIANNVVANFPSGDGIRVVGGNSSTTGPGGTVGTPGNATNIVTITGNRVAGQSSAKMGSDAIDVFIVGGNSGSRSQGNFDVSSNGTVANPLANMAGDAVLVFNSGDATMTATVTNNVIVANNAFQSNGISGGNAGPFGGGPGTPDLTLSVTGNTISRTVGNGILLAGGGNAVGTAKLGIRNNTVGAPLSGVRPGIRVDAGDASSGDDAVCLDIRNNTSAGSGGAQGIGLSKQGTTSTTNDFGIEGMAATASPGVEQYVDGLNPSGGGTLLLSATSGFSNCDTAP